MKLADNNKVKEIIQDHFNYKYSMIYLEIYDVCRIICSFYPSVDLNNLDFHSNYGFNSIKLFVDFDDDLCFSFDVEKNTLKNFVNEFNVPFSKFNFKNVIEFKNQVDKFYDIFDSFNLEFL